MEVPPSSSRQPPDGDEFPDFQENTTPTKPTSIEDSTKRIPFSWGSNTSWKNNGNFTLFKDQQSSCSVRDKIAKFSNGGSLPSKLVNFKKIYKSTDDILSSVEKERFDQNNSLLKSSNSLNRVKRSASTLCKSVPDSSFHFKEKSNNSSNTNASINAKDKSSLNISFETCHKYFPSEEKYKSNEDIHSSVPRLHTRSQSLMDINYTNNTQPKDRWSILAEQRQKSLSKLKGLIIPERVVEIDSTFVIDLPEIKNNSIPSSIPELKVPSSVTSLELPTHPCQRNSNVPPLSTPPLTNNNNNNANSIPKYSPAFKRKSLQIHNEVCTKLESYNGGNKVSKTFYFNAYEVDNGTIKLEDKKQLTESNICDTTSDLKIVENLCLGDAPKSLESITSPTQSDCSFEYINTFSDTAKQEYMHKSCQTNLHNCTKKIKESFEKSEDESDDSAVSSSQSSYISRTSPPTSPSHINSNFTSRKCNMKESDTIIHNSSLNDNHRLLKAQSVEAINRKNILASAKCRSGRDLKIGSPLIQRRFEEASNVNIVQSDPNITESRYCVRYATIYEKSKDPFTASANNTVPNETTLVDNESSFIGNEKHGINKVDIQNESSQISELSQSSRNENNIKSFVNSTAAITNNTTISINKFNDKNQMKLTGDTKSNKERNIFVPRILTKDLRATNVTDLRNSFEKLSPIKNPNNAPILNQIKLNASSAIKNILPPDSNHSAAIQLPPKKEQINVNNVIADEDILEHVETIALKPEIPGGSVGITLAGGADYETKEITVHKIRQDSSAHRNGRLQKGDRIISINGKSVNELTHKQLVTLLKEPLPEVTLTIVKPTHVPTEVVCVQNKNMLIDSPKSIEIVKNPKKQKTMVVLLIKDSSGLGLSLEGGKDSPLGNMPLLIKKIFKGGAAEKCGKLQVGDELVLVNETDLSSMSRFEAWSVLKKLPEDIAISLTIRR